MKGLSAIGLMSGTSLDGLDLAWCKFVQKPFGWEYKIISSETIEYSKHWEKRLRSATELPGRELLQLHEEYGRFLGATTRKFIKKYDIPPETIIASHGHTVFHVPENGYTFQAGSGASIAAETGLTVVSDFRSADVALGGQGAPLVPLGDELLFPEYDFCLNIGGFANISFRRDKNRIAFDICPANILINHLVIAARIPGESKIKKQNHRRRFLTFDPGGSIAKHGNLNAELLKELNELDYYKLTGPRSLGLEWVNENVFPIVDSFAISLEDKLRTIYDHIAMQISSVVKAEKGKNKILVTGGGAMNLFLLELIKSKSEPEARIVIPSQEIVHFKEALIFAFLGVLRILRRVNTLSMVTGSRYDHSGGAVYLGKTFYEEF
ncbi:MAG TPA: anhydro-N-acetylmuramic acid kinase [Bacteroidales bacterium]|nr:anhydro-N-acetylmuramic acid kinase [Bacteroidales bacterium]